MKTGSSQLNFQQDFERRFQNDFQRYAPQTFLELQEKTTEVDIRKTLSYQQYLKTYISCIESGICTRTNMSYVEKIFRNIEIEHISSNMASMLEQDPALSQFNNFADDSDIEKKFTQDEQMNKGYGRNNSLFSHLHSTDIVADGFSRQLLSISNNPLSQSMNKDEAFLEHLFASCNQTHQNQPDHYASDLSFLSASSPPQSTLSSPRTKIFTVETNERK